MRVSTQTKTTTIAAQRPSQTILHTLLLAIAAAAGLSYASFPLAFWLNKPMALHGEVSTLGESGQPYAGFFNHLDIISGVLLTVLCVFLLATRWRQLSRGWRWAVQLLLVSGTGTIMAALFPLPGFFVFPNTLHAFFSISTNVLEHGLASFVNTSAFIASTVIWWHIVRTRHKTSRKRMVLAWSILLIVTIGPLFGFLMPTAGAVIQRVFISLFAVWLVIFTHDALHSETRS